MRKFISISICLLISIFAFNMDAFARDSILDDSKDFNIDDFDIDNFDIDNDINIDDQFDNILGNSDNMEVDSTERVYDYASLFSDSERSILNRTIESFIDQYDLDLVIATIDDNTKSSTREYAWDFYSENDFGMDNDGGLLFLIDMDNREFYMLTDGEAKNIFNDDRVDECLDAALSFIKNEGYFEGVNAFIGKVNWFARLGRYDERLSGSLKVSVMPWRNILIFTSVVTTIIIIVLVCNNKMVRQATSSRQYLTSSDVSVDREVYLGTHVDRRARPKPSDNDNFGGHSGSSGGSSHSYGGGGRKF